MVGEFSSVGIEHESNVIISEVVYLPASDLTMVAVIVDESCADINIEAFRNAVHTQEYFCFDHEGFFFYECVSTSKNWLVHFYMSRASTVKFEMCIWYSELII